MNAGNDIASGGEAQALIDATPRFVLIGEQ